MQKSLLFILAHPDDESLGVGSTIAKYTSEGVDVHLICATKGERGWMGNDKDNPGESALGKIREAELGQAAKKLGIKNVFFLDYLDGDLDKADANEVISKITNIIRDLRPQVTISFAPDGAYGHPDHIAISQFALGACILAADSLFTSTNKLPAYNVSKFYYFVSSADLIQRYTSIFGDIRMEIDGVARSFFPWPDWMYTTLIDGSAHWKTALDAVNCHKSQVGIYGGLSKLSDEESASLWGKRTYYRVFSLVNGGRALESDFFEGIS